LFAQIWLAGQFPAVLFKRIQIVLSNFMSWSFVNDFQYLIVARSEVDVIIDGQIHFISRPVIEASVMLGFQQAFKYKAIVAVKINTDNMFSYFSHLMLTERSRSF
jgi:hypothetical protein